MPLIFGKRVHDTLNKQIAEELVCSYTFLSMSNIFADMGLGGCSKWAAVQVKEHLERAMRIYNHMRSRNGKVKFLQIQPPKQDWRAPLHIFEEIVKIEQKVSSSITTLYEFAVGDKDYQSQTLLMWFVEDQMKREAFSEELLNRFRKMQSTDLGVFIFDEEMERRVPKECSEGVK
ncbi:ferritin [Alphaproteobacteria bacterium]|nr:ferritin [Alphaproteobacteria bacterium]